MSMLFPGEEEKKRIPILVLYELNDILDESKPLPRRTSLLIKWMAFFHTIRNDVPIPRPEELTPERLRDHAMKLVRIVAEHYR